MAALNDLVNAVVDGRPQNAPTKPVGGETTQQDSTGAIVSAALFGVVVLSTTWRSERPKELLDVFSSSFPSRPQGALECLSVTQTQGAPTTSLPYLNRQYQQIGNALYG